MTETAPNLYDVVRLGDTLVVTPLGDLREYAYREIEAETAELLHRLEEGVKNVIVDFSRTDAFGSTAMGQFVRLWHAARRKGGKMAFCNLSAHEQELLEVAHLDVVWPICASRAAALEAVRR